MGMGWHILRRTTLISFALGVFGFSPATLASKPLVSQLTDSSPPYTVHDGNYRRPLQNHAPPKAWSIDIDTLIGAHPEIAEWVAHWTTTVGLNKIRLSHERLFEYRRSVNAIIRSSGLPWEIMAIPIVESNWRTDAVSSSGAAGPWQFLESTARGRQLVIDAWRDERRDIWKSTEAAVQELAFCHRLFSDWLLAIASYNAGPTIIKNLRRESGSSGFWELLDSKLLPSEAEKYLPQVLAVAYITAHSGRFGLPLKWEEPTLWVRLPLNRSVPLNSLAAALGYSHAKLRSFHRELNHPFTPPSGLPYFLKIPKQLNDATVKWISMLDDSPLRFWRYTVKSGDTLSHICKRYDIPIAEMLLYNSHVQADKLRIGERLYIPGDETVLSDIEIDALPDWKGRYKVESGDTFWSIAKRYRITPEMLADVNYRPLSDILRAGSVLRVPEKR